MEQPYLVSNHASKSFAFRASVIDHVVRIGRTGFSLYPLRRVPRTKIKAVRLKLVLFKFLMGKRESE
jgi:hypothetical protein